MQISVISKRPIWSSRDPNPILLEGQMTISNSYGRSRDNIKYSSRQVCNYYSTAKLAQLMKAPSYLSLVPQLSFFLTFEILEGKCIEYGTSSAAILNSRLKKKDSGLFLLLQAPKQSSDLKDRQNIHS